MLVHYYLWGCLYLNVQMFTLQVYFIYVSVRVHLLWCIVTVCLYMHLRHILSYSIIYLHAASKKHLYIWNWNVKLSICLDACLCTVSGCRSRQIDICQGVSHPVLQCTWDGFTSGMGGRHACGQGQGLQLHVWCKCNAKPRLQLVIFNNETSQLWKTYT